MVGSNLLLEMVNWKHVWLLCQLLHGLHLSLSSLQTTDSSWLH